MSAQLVLDLPHRPALEADDFLVSKSNETAVRLIDSWPSWSSRVHLIVGPAGCGKSHLAHVWQLASGAKQITVDQIGSGAPEHLVDGTPLLLEDAERCGITDRQLFHLLNLCNETNSTLLMTARQRPARWPVKLPDLVSRLRTVPAIAIGPPDETLLRAVLVKHFSDRQVEVAPEVITYLTARMERSMEAACELADLLDRAALSAGRKITRQLAGNILDHEANGKRR